MAYLADAFGGRPSDYCDEWEHSNSYTRFCVDEAALLVLSDAKKESYDKIHGENAAKDASNVKKDDGGNIVADNKSVVNAMKMRSNAALKAAQRKAMTR